MQVHFPGKTTCAKFDVTVIDNDILESNETFNVFIDPFSLPYGVGLCNNASAEVTILNDDSK